jgi:hypothetical protein
MKKWSLKVVARLAVVVMLFNLLLVPSAQAKPDEGCGCGKSCASPGHFLEGITIVRSEEVKGRQKDRLVMSILNSPDVQNVVQESRLKFDDSKAQVVVHTLDTGNTLLAVGMPSEKGALIYYEVAEPLGDAAGKRFKSQAMLHALEGDTIKLISMSVNGRLVSPLSPRQTGAAPTDGDPCGGCQSINYSYWGQYCSHYDGDCIFGCCWGCLVACGSGNPMACFICVAIVCPLCMYRCCDAWSWGCIPCGTLP